ncbi:MAG: hypothetical protein FWC50_11305 [Planctomycetaceae bacterium]|nr:hypothetical protein [Planctomycetaceae bacterium]
MNFRKTISAFVSFLLLAVIVTGCDWSGDVAPPEQRGPGLKTDAPDPSSKADELDVAYEQLLRKRLAAQEKIEEAMKLYRTTSEEVYKQQEKLQRYLKDKSVPETIELFTKSKRNEIPPDLLNAHSCWQTLLPDKTLLLKIDAWIDSQQSAGHLEEMDVKIKDIDNYRKLGKILDQADQREVDRLLAVPLGDWNPTNDANNALYEQSAIEKIKTELTNRE